MSSANYPAPLIRQMIGRGARGYGISCDAVVLPNHVQVVCSDDDATVVRDASAGATLISMVSVAFGLQAGLALWSGVRRRVPSQRPGDG